MALTFDWTKCNPLIFADNPLYGWEDNDKHKDVAPVTKTLIFSTLSVGLGKITQANIDEFFARMVIVYRLDRTGGIYEMVDNKQVERMISEQEVIDHIGLTTNVSNETRAQWARRLFVNKQSSITEDLVHQFKRVRKQMEQEMVDKVMESISNN